MRDKASCTRADAHCRPPATPLAKESGTSATSPCVNSAKILARKLEFVWNLEFSVSASDACSGVRIRIRGGVRVWDMVWAKSRVGVWVSVRVSVAPPFRGLVLLKGVHTRCSGQARTPADLSSHAALE